MLKPSSLTLIFFLLLSLTFAQSIKTIKVFFLYGSKPAAGYKDQESRYFGGKHGGHVTISYDSAVVGFVPYGAFHIIAHNKDRNSIFSFQYLDEFINDTADSKYTTFEIPVTDSQYVRIKQVTADYLSATPYDYAFIGMRCASAAYDILSMAGIFRHKSKFSNILSNFYPKKLRKKLFRLAKHSNYIVTQQNGRPSRKWEKD